MVAASISTFAAIIRNLKKQRKYGSLRGLLLNRVSQEECPAIVEKRERIGDCEGVLWQEGEVLHMWPHLLNVRADI